MFAYPLSCGNCQNVVDLEFQHVFDYHQMTTEQILQIGKPKPRNTHMRVELLGEKDLISGAAYCQCPRCNHPNLILYECTRRAQDSIRELLTEQKGVGLFGGYKQVAIVAQYPEPKEAVQDPHWPDSVRKKFVDVQKMVAQQLDPAFTLVACRTVLELAIREAGNTEEKKSLYDRINDLHCAGILTTPLNDWAHQIRLDGNAAAHEGKAAKLAAEEYVEFLKLFLTMVFSLSARIDEKRLAAKATSAQE